MSMFKWEVVDPGPGEAVAPHQRLAWGKTVGLGAQHVIAMFGATFVFPIIMGLNANLAIMMSGIATICFLLIVKGKVPSYLGTSASFVGGATAIYTYAGSGGPGGPADVTGAILISGVVLALVGLIIHFLGADVVNLVLPPVVTGAVVMLIGFNLAGVATNVYMPADPWIALLTMAVVVLMAVGLRGFAGRIAIFLGLIVGYLVSWLADAIFGTITTVTPSSGGEAVAHDRVDWSLVEAADWFGFPNQTADGLVGNQTLANNLDAVGWHLPSFSVTFALLALPAVIALVAENIGHVKAVSGMTGIDLDPVVGRAVAADGVGTVLTSAVGGSPTTTYAENIGVMAATRVYSTAAYFVAAFVAILLGLIPKFGAIVNATPAGVLGGITLVLYGMIGLLGAKIWIENRVNFANPANLVPIAAGLILGIGYGTTGFFEITDDFQLGGIAVGTIVIIAGYHIAKAIEPKELESAKMDVADRGQQQ
jgi:uracil-xanthine permease